MVLVFSGLAIGAHATAIVTTAAITLSYIFCGNVVKSKPNPVLCNVLKHHDCYHERPRD